MTWYLAPSLVQLRKEINALWPNRDKSSDGSIGDASHSARASDHNPDGKGCVHAIDTDKDGIDPAELLREATSDPRVHYVIWQGHEYDAENGFRPVAYHGINGHYHHMHISIKHTTAAENSTAPWFGNIKPTLPPVHPALPTGVLTVSQISDVMAELEEIKGGIGLAIRGDAAPKGQSEATQGNETHPANLVTLHNQNAQILAVLNRIATKLGA